jgi:DNA-binding NtrC family response regulator
MPQTILVADDDPVQRRLLEEAVKRLGFSARTVENGAEAVQILASDDGRSISLLLLDLAMPGLDGMGVLAALRDGGLRLPVVVQTANGSIDAAIAAMRAGAADFVVKPVSAERLDVTIRNALKLDALESEVARIKRRSDGDMSFRQLISGSPAMARVLSLGMRAAGSAIPVLIEGESGVGKELVARAIHGESARRGKAFVAVNCGAIPENLVESVLFGHEKGAFTGAVERRVGKFAEAHGGTLFLDEVGELTPGAQVKLLRALQDGEIDAIGAKKSVKVDFRLVSATNQDMIRLVKEGRFREDLYYRLNVFPIHVPPLRERLDDVPALVRHFVARFAAEEGKIVRSVDRATMQMLESYSWPGNIRQLENAVFRAIVLADDDMLTSAEFPQIAAHMGVDAPIPAAPAKAAPPPRFTGPAMLGAEARLPETIALSPARVRDGVGIAALNDAGEVRCLEAVEADMIRLAIGRYRGRMTEIARRLGIGRSTLYRKMRDMGLEAPQG